MSVLSKIKRWDGVRYVNRYRKSVRYVLKHYKSDKSHSLPYVLATCYKAYRRQIYAYEFCYLKYMDLSAEERRNIVSWEEQREFYSLVNTEKAGELLCDKHSTYLRYKDFYKRELCRVWGQKENDRADFIGFARKHGRLILKPLDAYMGSGIRIIDTEKMTDGELEELLKDYPEGMVAESLIVQSEELGKFHPQSVNTIRVNTIRYDDEVEVKWPCLRIGRGASVVDNAGSGGVFAAIDENGVTIGAADEKGNSYMHHPDTGLALTGFRIPHWDEACAMVKQLGFMLPENRFTGWDLALTDNGWVMVEGNYTPLIIWQIAARQGIRPGFEQMRNRLGLGQ